MGYLEIEQPKMKFHFPRHKYLQLFIATVCFVVAAYLPLIWGSDLFLSILCQIGIMSIFALSYNLLLGQTGLLSFGHAVYFGFGAYGTIQFLNYLPVASFIPLTLLPLVGGIIGLLAAIFFGIFCTKKSGTIFAMISLGIAELVHATSLMFPEIFGGEGGISVNRVTGFSGIWGVTYGPQIEFYYLILCWFAISVISIYWISSTPLGLMANAVRDNPIRSEFIGYSPEKIRYLMFVISGFYAGIAGGINALNYEFISPEIFGLENSVNVLIATFLGGTTHFYGPIMGSILLTAMESYISTISSAWLFYLGLLFIFMVLYLPGGIASLFGKLRQLGAKKNNIKYFRYYFLACVIFVVFLTSTVGLIEMTYINLGNLRHASDKNWKFFSFSIDVTNPLSWFSIILLIIVSYLGLRSIFRSTSPSLFIRNNLLSLKNHIKEKK